ncbi:MAG: hypothetical protein ACR2MF_04055 [Chthoniobacterales bacterium]
MSKMKQAAFSPERQREVRDKQVPATEMLFDLDTARVFFTGRQILDINETVMSITLADAANLAAQMLALGANVLIESSRAVTVANRKTP